jgi:hypothetical protein
VNLLPNASHEKPRDTLRPTNDHKDYSDEPIFLPMGATAIACIALIAIAAMRLSQLGDRIFRQEVKLNLILAKLDIAFPPPPSAAVQAIARTRRVAAVKAYRQETGLGLKQALDIIDQWRARQQG